MEPRFFVIIKVMAKRSEAYHTVIIWDNLPFHVRMKWSWYFEYRAALAKVQFPRHIVDFHWGKNEEIPLTQKQELSKALVSAKRTLSKYKNKLVAFEKEWTKKSIYPPSTHPGYKPAVEKIARLEGKKEDIEAQLRALHK